MMKQLFERTKLNQVVLKNRFVRSATWEGSANQDGSCSEKIKEMMVELARGQVGMIITGHAYIHPAGRAHIGQLGIDDDFLIASYSRMIKAVQDEGSRIVLQINHAGGRAAPQNINEKAIGPSSLMLKDYCCREMTVGEIKKTITDFKNAAVRAKKAGFDGVQIHGAHGFLLSEFLSPYFNRRIDHYGGSLENRSRIIVEILQSIRSALGKNFLVTMKLNSDDFIEGGFTLREMVPVSVLLEKEGVDAIEVSGGTSLHVSKFSSSRINKGKLSEDEVYYREAARILKKNVSVPLVLVGGIRSFDVAKELIEKEEADYISLSRPLIREPDLIKRWQSGDFRNATCISCNQCFVPARAGEGLYCVMKARNQNG